MRSRAVGQRCPVHPPQENVLKESEMMIPETRQRLEAALADLQAYLVRACCCAPPRALRLPARLAAL